MRLLAVAIIIGFAATCAAQNKDVETPKFEDPYGVAPWIVALDDIRFFDSVSKITLTKEQIDKILPALDDVRKPIKDLQAAEAKDLLAIKNVIKQQREDSLHGKAAPDSFWEKTEKVDAASRARRASLRTKVIKDFATKLKPILTDDQYKKILEISKKRLEEMKDAGLSSAKEEQIFWFYVENVFVAPPRAYQLMQELAKSLDK